jgi:uncharacterized protein (TIGR00369 family)
METSNAMCFVCGVDNPIGLHLQFTDEEWASSAEFITRPEFQGYQGILHGGIMSTLLDEIMARPLNAKGISAVTAKLEVRFRQAVPIGTKITVRGELVSQRGRLYEMKAALTREDGESAAEATATFMAMK